MTEENVRFKLYKSNKKWIIASIATVSLLMVSGKAQADQLPPNGGARVDTESAVQASHSATQTVTLPSTTVKNRAATPANKPADETVPAQEAPAAPSTAADGPNPAPTDSTPQQQPTKPVKQLTARPTPATVQKPVTPAQVHKYQRVTPPVSPTRQTRTARVRTAVSPVVATLPVAPTDDQLIYDDAPIDEWMPNKRLQAVLLRNLQGNGNHWNNNLVDPGYSDKTWNSVDDITKSDMLLLKSFSIQVKSSTYIDGKTSYSIEGLQYATNLESLDLLNVLDSTDNGRVPGYWHGDITDLSPIKNLTKLTFLQFSNNRVSDISALANMKKLTYISAIHNSIRDFSMLDAAQFDQGGLNIGGQEIWRAPVYLKPEQDTVLMSNLGLKLPQNYNAVLGHYGEPTGSTIDFDYWSWHTLNPSVINVYRRGANGTAIGDTQVEFKVVKSQVTPGPTTSSVAGSGIGIQQLPYTYYLVACYYDGDGRRVLTYYAPYITDAQVAAPVTVHYTNQQGASIAPDTVLSDGAVGQTYTTTPKTIAGYTLDQSKLPANATGTFGTTAIAVTYVYDQNESAPVTVTYVDETTGAAVAEPQVLTGKYGESYTTQAKAVTGYTLQKVQGPATGTFTDQAQQVTYFYAKTSVVVPPTTSETRVTVHYQTADGTPVAPDVVLTGKPGEAYATSPVTVTGYQLVTTPTNAQGTFSTADQVVTYLYEEVTSDGDGDQITPDKPDPAPIEKPTKPDSSGQPDGVQVGSSTTQARPQPGMTVLNGRRSTVAKSAKSSKSEALPQTDEWTVSSWWGAALLGLLTIGGWLGWKRKKE